MSIEVTISELRDGNRPTLNPDGTVLLESIDFSSVDTYLRCPEQWRRRYILGERKPPGIALIEGTSHHASMESDNKEKLHKGKQLKAAKLTDIFVTRFREERKQSEEYHAAAKLKLEWAEETEDNIIARAKILHLQYADKYSKLVVPAEVEEPFSATMPEHFSEKKPLRVHGQIDVLSSTVVYDYKTSAKAKSQQDLDNNLQLTLYSWAKKKSKVAWIALVKTKEPYVQMIESVRTPGQWAWGLKVVARAVDGIRRGSFPLTNPGAFPPPWWCSEKFCGYFSTCRGQDEAPA